MQETQAPQAHSRTAYLEHDRIFPLLVKLSLPATVGMVVNAMYNVLDTVFVGQGVGPLAIAALSIVFPIQTIVSAVAQGIGVGTASIISRQLGEKKAEEAAAVVGTAYATVLAVTATLVALLFVFMKPILVLFGASPETMPYAMEYASIVGAGFFFFSMSMCASTILRAEGDTKASMAGMITGALVNAVLAPLFIFVLDMGVRGAGYGAVAGQTASCLYLFGRYARRKTAVPLRRAHFRIRADILGKSVVLGLPAFMQSAGLSLLVFLVNTTAGAYGGDAAITTYGMAFKLLMIVIMPVIGVVQGFQPIAGYNYGARRFDRVRASLKVTMLTAAGISMVGYAFMMLFPRVGVGFFTSDPELIKTGARALRIIVACIPAAAVQMTGSVYFQAVGKATESIILGLSRQFFILIPLVLVLPLFLGLDGVWISYPLADILATSLTLVLLVRELKKLGRES